MGQITNQMALAFLSKLAQKLSEKRRTEKESPKPARKSNENKEK